MKPVILIHGCKGRMGQAVAAAAQDMGLKVGAAVDAGDDVRAAFAACDVAVDFSSHAATRTLLETAVALRKPVVIGTTGHASDEKRALLASGPETSRSA